MRRLDINAMRRSCAIRWLHDERGRTFVSIGKKLGLTSARIQQIYHKSVSRYEQVWTPESQLEEFRLERDPRETGIGRHHPPDWFPADMADIYWG